MKKINYLSQLTEINYPKTQKWNQIKKNFISLVKDKYDGIDSFSDIEQDLKFSKLYLPICELYSQFINKYGEKNSNRFFSWFSGSKDYLKIISWTKKSEISIQDYNISDILPEKVCSWIELSDEANPYIYIKFSSFSHPGIQTDFSQIHIGSPLPRLFPTTLMYILLQDPSVWVHVRSSDGVVLGT